MIVRRLESRDVEAVTRRVRARLHHDATRHLLLNDDFDDALFADALRAAEALTWIAEEEGVVVGHLYGAILESADYGGGAWLGPDGVSFDNDDVLAALYAEAGAAWIADGASEHYAWVFDAPEDTNAWHDLGFSRMHRRGVLPLADRSSHPLPSGYELRRGGPADLALALELEGVIDEAQRRGPSFSMVNGDASRRSELLETLEDEEVHYYIVEYEDAPVAQCVTFPLDARRGSFDATLHVSSLVVRPEHEHRGVARALVEHALSNAANANFRYAEANWRVTNRRADRFWVRFGFLPTYVRLHRTIGRA